MHKITLLSLLALPALLGCGGGGNGLPFEPAGPGSAPDPMAPGPFPVGVTTIDLLDDARPNPDTGEARFLRTEIWYPAVQSAADGQGWHYDLKAEVDDNIDLGDAHDDFMASDLGDIESTAVRGADIDQSHAPYPVVLFSHGAYSLRFQYVFYTVHLASHGYVVVAADHQENTIWDVIRDGFDESTFLVVAPKRLDDMTFLMDQLRTLASTPGHLLEGAVDLTSTSVAGHSFGGFTAACSAYRESSLRASVLLTPVIFLVEMFGHPMEDYPGPVMLMGGTRDNTIPWKDQYCGYRRIGNPEKHLYELVGGGHVTFSNTCDFDFEGLDFGEAPDPTTDGCSPDNVPYSDAHQTINHYSTAFLNTLLRGSPSSLDHLEDRSDGLFSSVNYYEGDGAPDWPEGGCDAR